MVQVLWTILYIALGLWIFSRSIAYIIQWLLKRYLDVTLRFGKVGFLSFGNVQMTLQRDVSVNVELEKIWLSSSFVNPDVRKPVVICIEDMRIQVDAGNHGDHLHEPLQTTTVNRKLQPTLNQLLSFGSYFGLRINNMTVMLLKTMLPDCLMHFSSPEITLDSGGAYDKYEMCINLNNFGCKALRTSADMPSDDLFQATNDLLQGSTNQNCLGEFSFTFKMEVKMEKGDQVKLVAVKSVIAKPQMMITEGFLQSLQLVNIKRQVEPVEQVEESPVPPLMPETSEENLVLWPTDTLLSRLKLFEKMQDVSFDISDLNVQIVRETKQSPVLLSWIEGKNFSTVIEVTDLSSTVSTAACSGLHTQLAYAQLNATIKPGGGGGADRTNWLSIYNGSCEVDIQNVSCYLIDAKLTSDQFGGKKHYWGTVFYLGILLMKVKKFGSDLKFEGMEDNIRLEWSTNLANVLKQLLSVLMRAKPQPLRLVAASKPAPAQEKTVANLLHFVSLSRTVKFDFSNINLFISNIVGEGFASARIKSVQRLLKEKECKVHVVQHLTLRWTTEVHRCLVEGLQEAKALQNKFSGVDGGDRADEVTFDMFLVDTEFCD
ncbi:hypothetical protein Btru_001927 [Bulinus truncatus]|nr:hypothetical protein Btru_001927 [Bulinus truncatus]